MKASALHDEILERLEPLCGPDDARVSGLQISNEGAVVFVLEVDPQKGPALEPLRQKAEQVVAKISGVASVQAVLTAQKAAVDAARKKPAKAPQIIPGLLKDVKAIIAVASGKGGVGKSTVTANLAINLSKNGQKVGLLDADIYGPSQPRMMGLEGLKPGGENGRIEPLDAYGVKVMSIGFMVDQNAPLIWRGPMVQSALVQLMRDVEWGALDVLLVDMPPGTGDAQLTMAQKVPLSGAIIVSTPQDIALLDARKGIEMFRKVNVPILGVVENMSMHVCSHCGHEDHIFGHGGAREEAEKMGVPFLDEIPLRADIRAASDAGEPSEFEAAYNNIAQQIIESSLLGSTE